MDTIVGDKNTTELFGISTMNCIIPFAMIRTNDKNRIRMTSSNHVHTHAITVEHVSNAITHLKSEKSDTFEGLTLTILEIVLIY